MKSKLGLVIILFLLDYQITLAYKNTIVDNSDTILQFSTSVFSENNPEKVNRLNHISETDTTKQNDSVTIRKNVVKFAFNKLSPPFYFELSYERVIKPKRTVVLSVYYQNYNDTWNYGDILPFNANKIISKGIGLDIYGQYRFYVSKIKDRFPSGFYTGFAICGQYLNRDITYIESYNNNIELNYTDYIKSFMFGIGGNIGYHFLICKRISLDFGILFLGKVGFNSIQKDVKVNNGYILNSNYPFDNFEFIPGGGIGIAF